MSYTPGPSRFVLSKASFDFQESPGAGTYTASIVLPPGVRILDLPFFVLAGPWDADTAQLTGGDGAHNYFALGQYAVGQDGAVSGITKAYDPLTAADDLWQGSAGPSSWGDSSYSSDYGQAASWYPLGVFGTAAGVPYPAGGVITVTIVTTGVGGSTGHLVMDVIGFGVPPISVAAMKT